MLLHLKSELNKFVVFIAVSLIVGNIYKKNQNNSLVIPTTNNVTYSYNDIYLLDKENNWIDKYTSDFDDNGIFDFIDLTELRKLLIRK